MTLTLYLILDATGRHVSTTTNPDLIADPLPDGWTTVTVTGVDADTLRAGGTYRDGTIHPPDDHTAPDPLAILTALPPAQAEALVRLGVGLASDAGALWDALEQIAPSNTARPSIDIITHHALEAGLALTEPGEPS